MVLAATIAAPACAGAMSPRQGQESHCRVVNGGKLPATSGGEAALCAAVKRAFAAQASGIAYYIEIRVMSASRLAATVTANGQRLPEQRFASMDRPLAKTSFDRFAAALAQQAAGQSK